MPRLLQAENQDLFLFHSLYRIVCKLVIPGAPSGAQKYLVTPVEVLCLFEFIANVLKSGDFTLNADGKPGSVSIFCVITIYCPMILAFRNLGWAQPGGSAGLGWLD